MQKRSKFHNRFWRLFAKIGVAMAPNFIQLVTSGILYTVSFAISKKIRQFHGLGFGNNTGSLTYVDAKSDRPSPLSGPCWVVSIERFSHHFALTNTPDQRRQSIARVMAGVAPNGRAMGLGLRARHSLPTGPGNFLRARSNAPKARLGATVKTEGKTVGFISSGYAVLKWTWLFCLLHLKKLDWKNTLTLKVDEFI